MTSPGAAEGGGSCRAFALGLLSLALPLACLCLSVGCVKAKTIDPPRKEAEVAGEAEQARPGQAEQPGPPEGPPVAPPDKVLHGDLEVRVTGATVGDAPPSLKRGHGLNGNWKYGQLVITLRLTSVNPAREIEYGPPSGLAPRSGTTSATSTGA